MRSRGREEGGEEREEGGDGMGWNVRGGLRGVAWNR